MTFRYMLCVCVCVFLNGKEMFIPAQLQDGEPSLSTVCDVFNIDLVAAPRHRFFLVSLCLQANAEMVPKFPSCYYMPLV